MLSVKDRILDVHGDICEIGGGRVDVKSIACSVETFGASVNDGKVLIRIFTEKQLI